MDLRKNNNPAVAAITLLAAIIFFAVALSALNDWVKLGVIVATLGVSGTILGQLAKQEHHYGFIIVRGVSGFNQMKFVAKHYGELSKAIADFGLTLGFGVFYGARLFGVSKKLALHVAAMVLFYALFLLQPATIPTWLLLALGFATGLFGFGFYFLAQHAYDILTIPATPPGVIPIVPGVTVPWEVVFALIIVAVVHELAHGVLCLVEKLRVKASGVLLFGILPVGAFVEPDEVKMAKMKLLPQLRILGAGTTSNAMFFVLFLLIALGLSFATPFLVKGVAVKDVFQNSTAFNQIHAGDKILSVNGIPVKTAEDLRLPAQNGVLNLQTSDGEKQGVRALQLEVLSSSNPSLSKGEVILQAGGKQVYTADDLRSAIAGFQPGTSVYMFTSKGQKNVRLNDQGKLGITLGARPTVEFENDPFNPFLFGLFSFLVLIVVYTYTLNFILATVNLLPLFFTDGQRIFTIEFQRAFGDKMGVKLSIALGLVTLGLLALNALPWFT